MGLATSPCRGAHQTGMPHGHGELPEHIGRGRTATHYTLSTTLVQSEGCRASRATADPSRPPSTIGSSALPCQLIGGIVTKPERSTRTKGGWVFNGGQSVGTAAELLREALQVQQRALPECRHVWRCLCLEACRSRNLAASTLPDFSVSLGPMSRQPAFGTISLQACN